jgi:hypothetical protein
VTFHVFVDESVRQSYLLCAVWISQSKLDDKRDGLRGLRRPRQRRIHFGKERPGRRRQLLDAFVRLDVEVRIYSGDGPALKARRRCMRALVSDFAANSVARLVIESGDHEDEVDRQVIYEMRNLVPELKDASYEHMRAYEEPMLWLADAFAWAYGAGPPWRRLIDEVLLSDRPV